MPEGATPRRRHRWTPEEIAWLRREAVDFWPSALAKRFARAFRVPTVHPETIRHTCIRHGIQPATAPPGWQAISMHDIPRGFGPGQPSLRAAAVGEMRLNRRGEVEVRTDQVVFVNKVGGGTYWKRRQLIVWEAEYGSIPEGHVVIRLDDDPTLDEPDNLMCIPRAALIRLNSISPLRTLPPSRELRRAAVLAAQIHQRSHDLGRGFRRARK